MDPNAQAADAPNANVDDQEIDQTLAPYGQWMDVPGYGRVWRPDPGAVGQDFTPYETAGTWVDSDAGWAFQSDWDWGWLPFHYGTWEYFGGYGWGWCPGYTWSPAWVEWRHGGGYVGWRPMHPRHGGTYDHRGDRGWHFQNVRDFGRGRIHSHLANPRDGLRSTQSVRSVPLRGTRVASSTLMHGRYTTSPRYTNRGTFNRGSTYRPGSTYNRGSTYRSGERPTWNRSQGYRQPGYGGVRQPYNGGYRQPYNGGYRQPAYGGVRQPAYRQPAQTYRPSGSYRAPARTYNPGSYRTTPSRSYSAPSRSYSAPSRSYSAPSHSSGSSHSSGGGHSSGGHSGGGGHHR